MAHDKSSAASMQDFKRPQSVGTVGRGARWSKGDEDVVQKSSTELWGHTNRKEPGLLTMPVLNYQAEKMRKGPTRADQEEIASRATFAANFCQNLLNKKKEQSDKKQPRDDIEGIQSGARTELSSTKMLSSTISQDTVTSISNGSANDSACQTPNMVIHVCDDAKKMKKDFVCPRDLLVQEMQYFSDYLSTEAQLWDEVDISVHCDIHVFEWLMTYVKQGLMSDPSGNELLEPLPAPTLKVENTVSILISSDFLKMERLVEECLNFCHDNATAVVAYPCNMSCINDALFSRLVNKFTPLELEELVDKKDKLRSKLFLYHLEQLFKPNYSTPQSPANAATLYMCQHCKRLLTKEQESFIECVPSRMSIDGMGRVVYSHEMSPTWNINTYISTLQRQEGLSPRGIYWNIWSLVNTLSCDRCHTHFQCCDIMRCPYHPQGLSHPLSGAEVYACCSQPAAKFSLFPHARQKGCSYQKHSVPPEASTQKVYSILLRLSDFICTPDPLNTQNSPIPTGTSKELSSPLLYLLQKEKPRHHLPSHLSETSSLGSSSGASGSGTTHDESSVESVGGASVSGPMHHHAHISSARQQQPSLSHGTMETREDSELEEDDDDEEEEEASGASFKEIRYQQAAAANRSKKKTSVKQRQHTKGSLAHSEDWIWDHKKSKRWNIDMQRESDERRQQKLVEQLAKMNTNTSKLKEVTYPGGIFTRLEAQFRAQQAAKAMALQTHLRPHAYIKKK